MCWQTYCTTVALFVGRFFLMMLFWARSSWTITVIVISSIHCGGYKSSISVSDIELKDSKLFDKLMLELVKKR